jgi:choline dehydrogenase-like flavoprotein
MEHPHGRAARVSAPDPYRLWNTFRKRRAPGGKCFAPVIRAGEHLQKRAGILNTSLTLKCQRRPETGVPVGKAVYKSFKARMHPTKRGRAIWRIYKKTNQLVHTLTDPVVRRLQLDTGRGGLYLVIRGEQAPNPDSRVMLSQERDALGVPQADLDWQLTALDKRTVAVLVDTLDQEFKRLGLGRVTPEAWLSDGKTAWPVDPTVSNHPIGGYHHMGTTRMADTPASGVVDADARVHGIDNLYVAGSSVFPTSGWANPVLTTLALTLRLADYLKPVLP